MTTEFSADLQESELVQQAVVIAPLAGRYWGVPETLYKNAREIRIGRETGDCRHREQAGRRVLRERLSIEGELIGAVGTLSGDEAQNSI